MADHQSSDREGVTYNVDVAQTSLCPGIAHTVGVEDGMLVRATWRGEQIVAREPLSISSGGG